MDFIKLSLKRNINALSGIAQTMPSSGTAEPIMPAEQYAQSMDFDALPEQKIFENDVNSPIPVKITFSQKDEAAPEYNGGITAREIFERLEFESRRYPQINREEL